MLWLLWLFIILDRKTPRFRNFGYLGLCLMEEVARDYNYIGMNPVNFLGTCLKGQQRLKHMRPLPWLPLVVSHNDLGCITAHMLSCPVSSLQIAIELLIQNHMNLHIMTPTNVLHRGSSFPYHADHITQLPITEAPQEADCLEQTGYRKNAGCLGHHKAECRDGDAIGSKPEAGS